MTELKPYKGTARKLVLSLDIGTTFSGMSYAVLDPGQVPKFEPVKRYPGLEDCPGDYRVPSELYYRRDGSVHSVGAEAAWGDVEMEPDYNQLVHSRWFKLHLRPDDLDTSEVNKKNIPALPAGKTSEASGESLWASVKDTIDFVLCHPNGWEGLQQSKMRQAAILAGLVPDTSEGRDRVHFVSEGEAGLHFCVQNCLTSESITPGERIMVVDAGGGTVDISSYIFKSSAPLSVEETSSPDCVMLGSVTVNMRAQDFFKERLTGSKYGKEVHIKRMMKEFEKSIKPRFTNEPKRAYYFPTGLMDNNSALGIKNGSLSVTHENMMSLFRPSLDGIVAALKKQFQDTRGTPYTAVFLIGGFSANKWLFTNLKTTLEQLGLRLYRPDTHASKAVADGAIWYYFERFVSYRIAKSTYGTSVSVEFDPSDPEHRAQQGSMHLGPAGLMLDNGFSAILKKGTRIRDDEEFTQTYCLVRSPLREMNETSSDIIAYTGNKAEPPTFMGTGSGDFKRLCVVRADISKVSDGLVMGMFGPLAAKKISVVLRCGAELQAQISWLEDGEEKRGPAQLVYDDPDGATDDVVSLNSS
ncbi:hypothetical protein OH76DRAFT_1485585 [Lentinus brumalis]|uniref:Actin-like ATPase domain-containing protein n=1 Tax=Lentinus brumalis TaxID=2498619 RepID=A0A371D1J1_9APHY|nr:hypothetical protein OH76DRAFT_1485585 [Polyporus brumalis]